MEKKICILIVAFIMLWGVALHSQLTIPRIVIQEVIACRDNYPDNVIYPEDGTISFKAYITSRPEYVLTDEHKNTIADFSNDYFSIRFNLGDFPSLTGTRRDWSVGETLRIEAVHKPTGKSATTEFEIEKGGSPIFRRNENAVVLEDNRGEEGVD